MPPAGRPPGGGCLLPGLGRGSRRGVGLGEGGAGRVPPPGPGAGESPGAVLRCSQQGLLLPRRAASRRLPALEQPRLGGGGDPDNSESAPGKPHFPIWGWFLPPPQRVWSSTLLWG